MYWTCIYYNVGEFNGQLKELLGERLREERVQRKLSNWLTQKEYPNAIKAHESYRMIKAMAIF